MTDRTRPVPQSRLSRLAALGKLAGGVAAGAVGEGLGRLARGERPHLSDLVLTPSNALRAAEQLSRLRGAAMKLGQMLSLDTGDILPRELTAILAQLRENAHTMPLRQLEGVLRNAWGSNWRSRFARFDMAPIAAASIGQVHRARLATGRELAVKVQYPGVAKSIDSDIDNVAAILRMSGLVPANLDLGPLLAEAKRQLREEANYLREAEQMKHYRALLEDDPRFLVPAPVDDLLHETVLPMDYMAGSKIETLTDAPQQDRNLAVTALLDLVLKELFEFKLMQTDPNFANYRFQANTGKIVLLDFGATRQLAPDTAEQYQALLGAGLARDRTKIRQALLTMEFVSSAQIANHSAALNEIIDIVLRQLARHDRYQFDFSDRAFVKAIREKAEPIIADRNTWRVPPPDKLFVQRKISGTVLLAVTLQAKVPLEVMLDRYNPMNG